MDEIFMGVFVLIVLITWIVGLFIAIMLAVRYTSGKNGKAVRSDEARTMQELHHLATRMEARVEALETLLLEQRERERATEHAARH